MKRRESNFFGAAENDSAAEIADDKITKNVLLAVCVVIDIAWEVRCWTDGFCSSCYISRI